LTGFGLRRADKTLCIYRAREGLSIFVHFTMRLVRRGPSPEPNWRHLPRPRQLLNQKVSDRPPCPHHSPSNTITSCGL